MPISDEKEEEYIITVSSSVFNYLKEEGAVEDDDGYLKAQAVKKDGTFFTNNKNIDHLKIETGNFSMIGTQIKMGGNIRIFFTGVDIRNQQVIKLGIFKGQVIIFCNEKAIVVHEETFADEIDEIDKGRDDEGIVEDEKTTTKEDTDKSKEKIITPEGVIITDIGETSNKRIDDIPNNWEIEKYGGRTLLNFVEMFKKGLRVKPNRNIDEDKYIVIVSKTVFDYLKNNGAENIGNDFLKAQVVRADGVFLTKEVGIDHIKLGKSLKIRFLNSHIRMAQNIRTFFTGEDIVEQKVIKLGVFKGQVMIFYDG